MGEPKHNSTVCENITKVNNAKTKSAKLSAHEIVFFQKTKKFDARKKKK